MPDDHLSASCIHICTTSSRSGIADYARDFQDLVLGPEGYALADPRDILNQREPFAPDLRIHVQLGIFQHQERLAMTHLMKRGFREIDATIHDPPFLTFPYFQFQSKLMMRLARGFDWYLDSFGLQRRVLERLRRVFVLSESGRSALLRLAPGANVTTIPFVIDNNKVWQPGSPLGPALLYFGFIGPNKGLEYALELHRALNCVRPGTHLHVVGQASGEAGQRYLAGLRAEYDQDVTFHGYVPDDQLDALFERAAHVILPFAAYKYVMPASSSVVQTLRRARIVWTTGVNAMPEVIRDDENGFILTMDVDVDARRLATVLDDEAMARRISDGARRSAIGMAKYPYRSHFAATCVPQSAESSRSGTSEG